MRKTLLALTAVLLCVLTVGCHVTAAAPPPLPTGAYDQTDAKANEFLQAAHGFSQTVSAGKLTATQASILNKLNIALNAADTAEQTYHTCLINSGVAPSATASANPGCLATSGLTGLLSAAQAAFGNAQAAITPTAP